jgi:hypothetical protein
MSRGPEQNYRLHLHMIQHRGKVSHEPEHLSDAGSVGTEGRAYVMRVDDRTRDL